MYINEIQKKNLFIWLFRWNYKRKLRKRYELLKQQYKDKLIVREAFQIWSEMILKVI